MLPWSYLVAGGLAVVFLSALLAWAAMKQGLYIAPAQVEEPLPPHGMRAWAAWLAKWELGWLAILAPFCLYPQPPRTWALLALPLPWFARKAVTGRFLPPTPFDRPIALLAAMLPIALLVTPDMAVSVPNTALLLLGIALFYAVAAWITTAQRLRLAVLAYAFAGVALCLAGLLGTDWHYKFSFLSRAAQSLPQLLRGVSSDAAGFHPNIVGGALLWVLLPQLALTRSAWLSGPAQGPRASLRVKIALAVASLLSVVTLILTQSRGAIFSAAAGGALLLYLSLPRWRIAIASLAALLVAAVVLLGPVRVLATLPDEIGLYTSAEDPANFQSRLEIWDRAARMIADQPLTGVGMGAFRKLLPVRYPIAGVPSDYEITHAHDQFLQVALDLGLPGLVAYLAIWIVAALLIVGTWRRAAVPWQRDLAGGIGAALLASFIFGVADAVVTVSKPGIFFWTLLGLTAALSRLTLSPRAVPIARSTGEPLPPHSLAINKNGAELVPHLSEQPGGHAR